MELFHSLNALILFIPVFLAVLALISSALNIALRYNEKQARLQRLRAEQAEQNKSYEQKAKERADFRARQDVVRYNRSEQSF